MGSVREDGLPCDALDAIGVVTFILSGTGSIGDGNEKYQIPKKGRCGAAFSESGWSFIK